MDLWCSVTMCALNVRFSVLVFLEKMGYDDTELSREETDDIVEETVSPRKRLLLCEEILKRAIAIRDENAGIRTEVFEAGSRFY